MSDTGISGIISQIIKNGKGVDELFSKFVEYLYSEVGGEDLCKLPIDHLYASAVSLYKLYKTRPRDSSFAVNIWYKHQESEYAVIEIVHDEVPFLVDSVANRLRELSIEIHLITYPMIYSSRDDKGKLLDFSSHDQKDVVMQFHIANRYDDAYYDELKLNLESILEKVNFAVEDWGKMRDVMHQGSDHISSMLHIMNVDVVTESTSFLEWLINKHYIFLGFTECKLEGKELVSIPGTELGILRADKFTPIEVGDGKGRSKAAYERYHSHNPIIIQRYNEVSVVHRSANMDVIVIKRFDTTGELLGVYFFLGLFTSTVYYQSVRSIPLVRRKVSSVVKRYGYPPYSHNAKELITAMEDFPRWELLQMTTDEIYDTVTGVVSLSLIPRVKVFVREDRLSNFVSCIIFIPENKFSTDTREVVENIVCSYLKGYISKRYVRVGESFLTRLQLTVTIPPDITLEYDVGNIERDIINAISVWSDKLLEVLSSKSSRRQSITQYQKYKDAFDIKYTTLFAPSQAVHDINVMENILVSGEVAFDIYRSTKSANGHLLQLKVYSPDNELPLSSTLPILENLGLFAIDSSNFTVSVDHKGVKRTIYIYHFKLQLKYSDLLLDDLSEQTKRFIEKSLSAVWKQEIDDDVFNALVVYCGISHREALFLRVVAKYLKQLKITYDLSYIRNVLMRNSKMVKLFVELFNKKFSPESVGADISKVLKAIKRELGPISDINEDKILSAYLETLDAIKRTNAFQLDENGNHKKYLSIKIYASEISFAPLPKPYAEIFVYAVSFEGIHLRGGPVARGGLRWSDRHEDFRTEVLGLMKAQMTKNSVIVPVGSKGGFITKRARKYHGDRYEYAVICYRSFLMGLLDITDNIVGNDIITPENVICYDAPDPYLVVAADKGTATFSDYANEISEQYSFWLSDAFASGGSAGYDHKKMGITARGAWVSVLEHFNELGIDINNDTPTVVGIGDMSGDVFGNGLLFSKNLKLIAAFNHKHIFIDPSPDAAKSYAERKRVFEKGKSSWSDYNKKAISAGGGVFERNEKVVNISPQAAKVLSIDPGPVSPDSVIKAILCAEVDLLWNGGIGTYVKASHEANEIIGDKTNDGVRVNGEDLRCRVVGEGGNLGLTQYGRIEYDLSGGAINTDALDNSAGVDCSDHEVNIKIGFSELVREKKLSLPERNKILAKMTDDVAELVLCNNLKQAQIISIEKAGVYLSKHAWFIVLLEHAGVLNREIEFLPSNDEIDVRKSEGDTMTRPELSVLLAYSKNSICELIGDNPFIEDTALVEMLCDYFPSEFIKRFGKKNIREHKLSNEILCMLITNDFVNTLGITTFHEIMCVHEFEPVDIVNAFVVIMELFNIRALWEAIEKLDNSMLSKKLILFSQLQFFIHHAIERLIKKYGPGFSVAELIEKHKQPALAILSAYKQLLTPDMLEHHKYTVKTTVGEDKSSEGIVSKVLLLNNFYGLIDIVCFFDKNNHKKDYIFYAKLYSSVFEELEICWLIQYHVKFEPRNYVQLEAIKALLAEIYDLQDRITRNLFSKKNKIKASNPVSCYKGLNAYRASVEDMKKMMTPETFVSVLTIAIKKIKELVK